MAEPVAIDRVRLLALWRWVRADLGACALMLLLALVFSSPGLPPGRVAAPMEQMLVYPPWASYFPGAAPYYRGGDLLMQQLPWRHWAQQEFQDGRFPLWASGPLGGSPLFADYQPGVLYPLHLLWVLMPVGAGLGLIMALKLWLAGAGMWGFLRAMRLHPAAALLGAVGLMFSTWLVDLLPWQLTGVYLLLPWMLWAALEWTRGSRGALPCMSVLVAFAVFAGHPELLFICGATVGLWVLGLAASYPRRALWTLGGMAVAAGLGFALAAVQLLPFLEALGLSHTSAQRTANPAAFSTFHFDADMMLYWILPRFWSYPPEGLVGGAHGFTEANGYAGLAPLLGVLLSVVPALRRRLDLRLYLPLAAMFLFSMILTYDGLVGPYIRSLPGFNQNVNTRWVAVAAFSIIALGAFGWDRLARNTPGDVGWRRILLPAGAVFLLAGLGVMLAHALKAFTQPVLGEKISIWYVANRSYQAYWAIWAGGVFLATVGAAAIWAAGRRFRTVGPVLLGLVALVDLWTLLVPINGTAPATEYFPETSFIKQVKALVPPEERVISQGEVLPANSPLIYGIRDWRSQDALMTERAYRAAVTLYPEMTKNIWSEYNQFLYEVNPQVAVMLGVRYFIYQRPLNPNSAGEKDPGSPEFTRLAYKDDLGLWRAEGVPGFAYLSDNVQALAGEKEAATWLRGVTWEQARAYAAVVEAPSEALATVKKDTAVSSPGGVSVGQYSPGSIRLQVDAARPALLVVAESWYPGWRALVDHQPVAVLRANYLSQGVVVPAGSHVVELEYSPGSFRYGLLVSLGALVMLALMIMWTRRRPTVVHPERAEAESLTREDATVK
ncbi:MAG TPA: hypothetical protein VM409_04330 [Chloroflexia bacterium]|nr:hypothetical protein [Chloroflexia bacterium]